MKLRWYAVEVLSALLLGVALAVLFVPSAFVGTGVVELAREGAAVVTERPRIVFVGVSVPFLLIVVAYALFGSSSVVFEGPDIEAWISGISATTAGESIDDAVDRLVALREAGRVGSGAEIKNELRGTLESTAVTVLMRTGDYDKAGAESALAEEEWTDDPRAVALFTEAPPPWEVRVRDLLDPTPAIERRIEAVLTELEERMDAVPEGEETGPALFDPGGVGEDGTGSRGNAGADDAVTDVAAVDAEIIESLVDDRPKRVVSRDPVLVGALFAGAVGLMTTTLTPLWIAVLGIGYVTFESVTMVVPPEVEVRRTLSTDNPLPGDLVEVTLEVKNVGNRTLPDVRVVDGVPDPLPVVEGTPSLHTGLVPDGTDEVTYVVRAKRGEFEFDGTRVVTRSLSGSREYATDLGLASRITCRTLLDDISLSDQTLRRIGVVRGDEGGGGIEFYATREYQEGDPMNRIDWNRLAKTNELTTIQFRERRAASVVLVVDERTVARVAPARTELDGVDLSVYAAERVFLRLLEEGNRVGLMSVADEVDAIAPRKGDTQRVRVQSQLRSATDRYAATLGEDEIDVDPPALGRRTSRETPLGRIERRLPEDAQVLLLSPVTDSFALEAAERLQARGHLVTVMTPDSVGSATHGERVRRLERLCRLRAIRETGARVVDWEPDEPIQSAVVRAAAYWT